MVPNKGRKKENALIKGGEKGGSSRQGRMNEETFIKGGGEAPFKGMEEAWWRLRATGRDKVRWSAMR